MAKKYKYKIKLERGNFVLYNSKGLKVTQSQYIKQLERLILFNSRQINNKAITYY